MIRLAIGLYQIITGFFGVVLIILSYYSNAALFSESQLVLNQVILGFFLYAIIAWAGFGMIKNQTKAKSVSLFLQAIQIPIIYSGTVIYKFTTAGFLSIGIKNNNFSFIYKLQPIDFTISTNYSGETVYMVYLVPLVFFILLIKLNR